MKIGLNYTPYIKGKIGGMGTYMQSLLHFFPKISPKDEFYVACHPNTIKKSKYPEINFINIPKQKNPQNLSILLKKIIDLYELDVWYSPLLVLDPPNCRIPSLVNIPDLQHKYFPHFFDHNTLTWRLENYQKSVQNANTVLTLSQHSRLDIIRLLDVPPSKVHFVHLGVPVWFNSKNLQNTKIITKYSLSKNKYLFYPANFWPHKNHLRLIRAFSRLASKFPQINLIFSGYNYNNKHKISDTVKQLNLQNRILFLGYIPNQNMPAIYKNALGLVFPSLFEGFGIPLLEAMKSKCPILCSQTTSLPEIGGKAALYFDPLSISDITQKLDQFLSNPKLRNQLVKNGQKQIKKFSYKKTTLETLQIIKNTYFQTKKASSLNHVIGWPKISVITPSYNQGEYIEKTIKSVLNQKYPNLEYIIVDGGSTDKTIDILKKYSKKIKWISEKDEGQTDAINKGIKMSTGSIISYLNSDDTYAPKSLKTIAQFFITHPHEKFVYGIGKHINKNDKFIENYPNAPTDYQGLHGRCTICQPTAFWHKNVTKKIGLFNKKLRYAMDYDYWIRVSKHFKLNFLNQHLANTRFYPQTKTFSQKVPVHQEIIKVQQKHYPKVHSHWILALVHVEKENINKKSLLGKTYFINYIVFKSIFYFFKFNHQPPPKNIIKNYLIWYKELAGFIIKKKYQSIF